MSKEAMRGESERLVKEAMARKLVVIKDNNRDGFLAGPVLRFLDRISGVTRPSHYWRRSIWNDTFRELGLSVREYSEPRRLHFIAVLSTENFVRAAGLSEVTVRVKPEYVSAMVSFEDPLYQKITANLPARTKPGDYITSLEITARKPGYCCG